MNFEGGFPIAFYQLLGWSPDSFWNAVGTQSWPGTIIDYQVQRSAWKRPSWNAHRSQAQQHMKTIRLLQAGFQQSRNLKEDIHGLPGASFLEPRVGHFCPKKSDPRFTDTPKKKQQYLITWSQLTQESRWDLVAFKILDGFCHGLPWKVNSLSIFNSLHLYTLEIQSCLLRKCLRVWFGSFDIFSGVLDV